MRTEYCVLIARLFLVLMINNKRSEELKARISTYHERPHRTAIRSIGLHGRTSATITSMRSKLLTSESKRIVLSLDENNFQSELGQSRPED